MASREYKYDVALSFAGADRLIARALAHALQDRGLSVFYDEWAKAELLGTDLIEHLFAIYRDEAEFCVPLFSRNYFSSKWTKHELKSARDRAIESEEEYILPIRLDDAPIQNFPNSVAYLDFSTMDLSEIVNLPSDKINLHKKKSQTPQQAMPYSPIAASEPAGFELIFNTADVLITDPDILSQIDYLSINPSPARRLQLARDLGRIFSFTTDETFGPVYTAWRVDDKVFLSTLPNVADWSPFARTQKTFEFELLKEPAAAVRLKSEWVPIAREWQSLGISEFHEAVKGIVADRSGSDMERESVLFVLQQRGVKFRFPVAPETGPAERFCRWIPRESDTATQAWDRDPRLVSPGIGINGIAAYHSATGEGVLITILHGSWSNRARYAVSDALGTVLPTRHNVSELSSGCMRITVHLGRIPPFRVDHSSFDEFMTNSIEWEVGLANIAIDRTHSAIARAVAAERSIAIAPPSFHSALPDLPLHIQEHFRVSVDAIGSKEVPEVHDYPTEDGSEQWGYLHHCFFAERLRIRETSYPFNFRWVVSRDQIESFISTHE
jgi:TIR domain